MRKLTLVLFFVLSFHVFSQTESSAVKVTLNTGAVFTGTVLLKNEEVIIIKNSEGAKFQFQLTEVKSITNESDNTIQNSSPEVLSTQNENFCGILELGYNFTNISKAADNQNYYQLSLCFGNKKALGKDIFIGLGAGYLSPINNTSPTLIPLFVRMMAATGKHKLAPVFGIETGYSFSANENSKGGPFASLSAGIRLSLNNKTALFTNVYGAAYSVKLNLIDEISGVGYSFYGNTSLSIVGLKLGLRF